MIYYIIFINLLGFFIMHCDKERAVKKQWRIKESTLIFISLIGGSVGMLLGMRTFHHKTKKKLFYIGVPLILILQLAAVLILYYLNYS